MLERRGRGRGSNRDRYQDDDDYSDYSDYDRPSRSATAPPKRHRSISRRALDRLSSTFGNLGLNKDKDSARTRSSGCYRDGAGDDSDYDTDYSTNYTHDKKRSSRSRHHSPDRDRGSGTHSSRYPPRASLNRQRSYSYSPERYESRQRGRSSHRSTGNSRDPRSKSRWARSIDAALDAAAIEAVRVRKEPGPWTGRKGSRVLTAAMAAAAVGVATDHRQDGRGDKKGKIGSALGGLVINRMLNGPRKDLRRDLRY
ncbi:hypothetical protein B0H65DRAFT_155561 [Neurospora tetraspora]|uniref:DUF3824 domain-containing protein n=1 Tax=Neurospora tetraspora TaxID=94610 RepID=A0AAE0JHW0_9PEZI|nr:hypothetical protein B0H65DRAFT_155561 [Neurospora tetraspora]